MKSQYCTNEIPRHFIDYGKQDEFNAHMRLMAAHLSLATGKRVEWWFIRDSCCSVEEDAGHFRIFGSMGERLKPPLC